MVVEVGIGHCDVSKVVIDTESSVNLIPRSTLDRMGVDTINVHPLLHVLMAFNASTKAAIGTVRLQTAVLGVTLATEFSVIDATVPYNAILGIPWITSMGDNASAYHQCVKFPGMDGRDSLQDQSAINPDKLNFYTHPKVRPCRKKKLPR